MKSLVWLLKHLLADAGRRCGAPVRRDILYVSRRVEHEGDSFITITLSTFARDFERALDDGRLGPSMFANFRKHGVRPAFLQDFMSQVFDSDGVLLKKPSSDCILAIRQVCLFAKKVLRPCEEHRNVSAEEKYLECEDEVKEERSDTPFWRAYSSVCQIVMSDILSDDYYEELAPRHGPGTTAQGIRGNSKYSWTYWTSRLEERFPFSEFAIGSVRNLGEPETPNPDFVDPEDELPVRVVFVPKTLKTPRVIAIEPVCMQYAQQAVAGYLIPRIEVNSGGITPGHVNFRDQTVNQDLALLSSRVGHLATLDMSEASDRVSLPMAKELFSIFPDFWELVDACRSRRATLPSGKTIPLKKFASMGSALCFPVEAMVFFCAIVASRILSSKARICRQTIIDLSRSVYVYGDDLIVPVAEAPSICSDLESFGLKVNWNKSFWTGKFRESCGMDAYDGQRVTPVYLRRDLPSNRNDSSGILSAVATCNQLYEMGYYRTAAAIKDAVEELLGSLPTVSKESQAVGWNFYSENSLRARWNKDLQRSELRCYVPQPKRVKDPIVGDPALVKCLRLIRGSQFLGVSELDQKHLQEVVGTGGLALKRRWVSVT